MPPLNRPPLSASLGRRTQVNKGHLLRAVLEVQEHLRFDPCQINVHEPDCPDPLIVVTEHEREHSILLSGLVDTLERAGTGSTTGAMRQGVQDWLDTRPVPDAVAGDRGVAILGWTGEQTEAKWQIVVPRGSGVLAPWVPTTKTSAQRIHEIRASARARSERLTVSPLHVGDVTMWVYMINPALSTAALLQPDLVCDGRPIEEMYAAVTPRRPVAVAPLGPAQRLVEASTESHVLMPLSSLTAIEWN